MLAHAHVHGVVRCVVSESARVCVWVCSVFGVWVLLCCVWCSAQMLCCGCSSWNSHHDTSQRYMYITTIYYKYTSGHLCMLVWGITIILSSWYQEDRSSWCILMMSLHEMRLCIRIQLYSDDITFIDHNLSWRCLTMMYHHDRSWYNAMCHHGVSSRHITMIHHKNI